MSRPSKEAIADRGSLAWILIGPVKKAKEDSLATRKKPSAESPRCSDGVAHAKLVCVTQGAKKEPGVFDKDATAKASSSLTAEANFTKDVHARVVLWHFGSQICIARYGFFPGNVVESGC